MQINILKEEETKDGWIFDVEIEDEKGKKVVSITLDRSYWQELFSDEKPAFSVKRSLEFLLQREPKEMILDEFDLRDISKYFKDFEKTIAVK